MTTVRETVRRLRNEAGLSQERLAALAGINKVTLVHIETGRTSPNVETLQKISRALGVETADLFPKTQATLFDFDPAERVRLGEVTSDRQRGDLHDELGRLFEANQAGEISAAEASAKAVDALNAALDAAARAGEEAG